MKKLLYIFFLLIATVKINYAQSVYIKVGDWAVANANLIDGKIKYESTSGGTPFSTSATFQRYEGSTQVRVQAIYVFEANGSQVNISDSIFVTTADFTNPYLSKAFIKTATLQPNNKNGIVKLKWRYLDTYSGTNARWSGYQYASKTYQTVLDESNNSTEPKPIYVMFSQRDNNHVYTHDLNDYPYQQNGFVNLGINFYAFSYSANGTLPVHVFFQPTQKNHVYTINRNDYPYEQNGFVYQGVNFYAFSQQVTGSYPVHVFYNPSGHDHVYTINRDDYPYEQNGFVYQGVNFYAFKSSTPF
jgi:hypothetical protein